MQHLIISHLIIIIYTFSSIKGLKLVSLRIKMVLLALGGSCNEEYRRRYHLKLSLGTFLSLQHLLMLTFLQKSARFLNIFPNYCLWNFFHFLWSCLFGDFILVLLKEKKKLKVIWNTSFLLIVFDVIFWIFWTYS